jgi:hypothetical protein
MYCIMKLNRLILFLTVVALGMRLYFNVYRRRERYVRENIDPKEVEGNVVMSSYDDKEKGKFEIIVDGRYILLKGKTESGRDYYSTIKDGIDISETNVIKPQGEYKFRLTKSVNGDDGYYSLAVGDSERYMMIDITNKDVGVLNLEGIDNPSSKVIESKAFNFKFKKM